MGNSNFQRDKISLVLSDRYESLNSKIHKMDFINVVVGKYRLWENFSKDMFKNIYRTPEMLEPSDTHYD